MSQFDDVGEFHAKFGLPIADTTPLEMIPREVFEFRRRFLSEELLELCQAYGKEDLAGIADALVDIVYVAMGTAHYFGIPFDRVFTVVQRANMQKERAVGQGDPRSKRGSALDVVKPEGWVPPDICRVLRMK